MRGDPRRTLLACMLFAALVVTVQSLAAAAVLLLLAALVCPVPRRRLLPRLLVIEGTVLLAVATLPFTLPGPDWTLPGNGEVMGGISRAGTLAAALILVKSAAVTLVMLAWLGPLGPGGIARGLDRLGAPPRLVLLFVLTAHHVEVLGAEYRRLRTAMRVRGFTPGFNRHTWRSLGYLVGMLMIRGLARAERVQGAMLCRGFDGRLPTLAPEAPAGRGDRLRDLGLAAGAVAAGLALILLDRR